MFLEHMRSGEINVAIGGRVRYTDGERRVMAGGMERMFRWLVLRFLVISISAPGR